MISTLVLVLCMYFIVEYVGFLGGIQLDNLSQFIYAVSIVYVIQFIMYGGM